MFDLKNIAMNLITRNPAIANNPQAQNYLNVIQNGDSARGQQIADNLCQTYGISRDEAIRQAKQFLTFNHKEES